MEETAKKVACLLNKSVTHGAKKYRDILKEEDVKDRNFVAKVKMLPTDMEIAKLEAMMNNAIATNPQFIMYIDPFKVMRIAKENASLAELYFRQAQKKFIKTEQEKAQANSEQNAQSQQASIQAKMQADTVLEEKRNLAKEKQIVLQGVFDLAKANILVPAELQQVVSDILQNLEVPVAVQNQQQQQALEQQAQQQEQQMEQRQMEQGQPQEQLQTV
jgi:isochorismate synthase EntC